MAELSKIFLRALSVNTHKSKARIAVEIWTATDRDRDELVAVVAVKLDRDELLTRNFLCFQVFIELIEVITMNNIHWCFSDNSLECRK